MANPWFRMYSEFSDDPKVQMMPEAMQRRLVMLFCSKCKGETLHETEIAFHWRISETELAETKSLFLQKEFIDEGWNLLNWNKRQFLSDSSTDRVRRHRQGKKQDETLHETPETELERQPVVTVTPPEQNRTDTEQKKSRGKHEVNPRFAPFREVCQRYYDYHQLTMTWDGAEGKQLTSLLSANPDMTPEQFRTLLGNRTKSRGVNHAKRPSSWLRNATDYAKGPLNEFGQPLDTPKVETMPQKRVYINQEAS